MPASAHAPATRPAPEILGHRAILLRRPDDDAAREDESAASRELFEVGRVIAAWLLGLALGAAAGHIVQVLA